METWETVTMSRKEARRPGLVQLAVAGKITTAEGARNLDMSLRQFRRPPAGAPARPGVRMSWRSPRETERLDLALGYRAGRILWLIVS